MGGPVDDVVGGTPMTGLATKENKKIPSIRICLVCRKHISHFRKCTNS